MYENKENLFKVSVIAKTEKPQSVVYKALHQDYSSDYIGEVETDVSEYDSGVIAIKRLLDNNRGHWGCLEHPQISLACGYINHGTMQQIRTHRIGLSFDCQSMRYTSEQFLNVCDGKRDIEKVLYFRPLGFYSDRLGNKIEYTRSHRNADIQLAHILLQHYKDRLNNGFPPEFARGMIPFDYRQHFVMSGNLRAMLHLLDVRGKKDAQIEIQSLCELIFLALKDWCPEILSWYEAKRYGKGLLAP